MQLCVFCFDPATGLELVSIIVRCGSLCGLALPGVHWLQEPYKSMKHIDDFYLFNLADDYHELHDLKAPEPQQFAKMSSSS